MKKYIKYFKAMISAIFAKEPTPSFVCPIRIDEKGMIAYAHSKGCTPPELTDDEKSMFFEGGIENFRKWMKDHNQYTGF